MQPFGVSKMNKTHCCSKMLNRFYSSAEWEVKCDVQNRRHFKDVWGECKRRKAAFELFYKCASHVCYYFWKVDEKFRYCRLHSKLWKYKCLLLKLDRIMYSTWQVGSANRQAPQHVSPPECYCTQTIWDGKLLISVYHTFSHRVFTWLSDSCLHSVTCSIHRSISFVKHFSSISGCYFG